MRGGGTELVVVDSPGEEPPRPVLHNDRAPELGRRPRAVEPAIVASAESLRDLGLLKGS
ncbi:hypothetical protein [Nonomuraea sp. NPDC050202]|uniref:hypothetical protein n=1 Tax=Nonomuraea sp. NPDC050202 TaxID=3155035 RepID=UPI0033EB1E87